MKKILLILFVVSTQVSFAQKNLSTEMVLQKIKTLQVAGDEFYQKGLFRTERKWYITRQDNCLVVNGNIAYILRKLLIANPELNQIIIGVTQHFEKYRSRRGRAAYNLWQTIPPDVGFPNSPALKSYTLADDYNNSSIVQLARGKHKMDVSVRTEMIRYGNRKHRTIPKHFPEKYQKMKCYEVWYADKMAQAYDIVVMANVMTFIFEKNFELNDLDKSTIRLISRIVDDKMHLKEPKEVSPFHANTALISYHLVRMIVTDKHGYLGDEFRKNIKQDLIVQLEASKSQLEKMMLYSSLAKLGDRRKPVIKTDELMEELKDFPFFSFEPKQSFLIPTMKWVSEALNWVLVYEFLVLHNNQVKWID